MINQTLYWAVVREMPDDPPDGSDWFHLFERTAKDLRTSIEHDDTDEELTPKERKKIVTQLNKIISHYSLH